MSEPLDLAQAAYLELATSALERRDLPALVSAIASLKTSTLDHVAAVTAHPVFAAMVDRLTVDTPGKE
jgi:hypothetical protein